MKLTIGTDILQNMVSKAVKGAGNNKLIPITGLLGIEYREGVDPKDSLLVLKTTDGNNHLRIMEKLENVGSTFFECVVPVDIFSKLIAKMTCEKIVLEITGNSLEVKGNGKYSIDLPMDEDGDNIKFISYPFNEEASIKKQVDTTLLKSILTTCKVSLADTMARPYLTGYYLHDKVVASDGMKVSVVNNALFDKPILMGSETADLLMLADSEKLTFMQDEDKLLFITPSMILFAHQLEDIEEYPIQAINNLAGVEISDKVKLPKQVLLNVLDRLSLFVTPYDNNGIFLTVADEGLVVTSQKSNANEVIKYTEPATVKITKLLIDILMLKEQIAANPTDTVELWYGHSRCIKMTFDKTIQIVSLLEEGK